MWETVLKLWPVLGFLFIQTLSWGIWAGTMSSRVKSIENKLSNGVTREVRDQGKRIDRHGETLAGIAARCDARQEQYRKQDIQEA